MEIFGQKPFLRGAQKFLPFASNWNRRSLLISVLSVTTATVWGNAHACDLPKPSTKTIVVVKGLIGCTNVADQAQLDRALLASYDSIRLRTWTPWTDGEIEFEGVLLRALFEGLAGSGTQILACALNDYEVVIPVSDIQTYDMLIAWNADGNKQSRRDKGPLWIVYPWSDDPTLNNRVTNQRAIWQLHELSFR